MSNHLPPAVSAALGPQVPTPQPERLAFVDVESPPRMIAVLAPTDGSQIGQYAEVDDTLGLTDLMAIKFREVCDAVDATECEASDCVASTYQRKGRAVGVTIGWVLAGEADERTEWRFVALVQRGREVIAVCEQCSPSWRYQGLWEG